MIKEHPGGFPLLLWRVSPTHVLLSCYLMVWCGCYVTIHVFSSKTCRIGSPFIVFTALLPLAAVQACMFVSLQRSSA